MYFSFHEAQQIDTRGFNHVERVRVPVYVSIETTVSARYSSPEGTRSAPKR